MGLHRLNGCVTEMKMLNFSFVVLGDYTFIRFTDFYARNKCLGIKAHYVAKNSVWQRAVDFPYTLSM